MVDNSLIIARREYSTYLTFPTFSVTEYVQNNIRWLLGLGFWLLGVFRSRLQFRMSEINIHALSFHYIACGQYVA